MTSSKSGKGRKRQVKQNRRGRPNAYSPGVDAAIIASVRKTGCDWIAAESAGISRHTLVAWRQAAKRGEPPYVDFLARVDESKAQFVAEKLAKVLTVKNSVQLRGLTWLLERLDRQLAGSSKVELSGPDGAPIQAETRVIFEYPVTGPAQTKREGE